MSDQTVSVPAEKIAALREALERHDAIKGWKQPSAAVQLAARAVVDAVETEDEPPFDSMGRSILNPNYGKDDPPARDDAETAIAGLLEAHDWPGSEFDPSACSCGDDWSRAHVASVIAAHMAAPDELTAREEA